MSSAVTVRQFLATVPQGRTASARARSPKKAAASDSRATTSSTEVAASPTRAGRQRRVAPLRAPEALTAQQEADLRKYSGKLYHLRKTIHSMIFQNGALSDELARLRERVHVVGEERKIIAKHVQRHERNRMRRLQKQQRKATTAALRKLKLAEELNMVVYRITFFE
ncbi:GRAM domain containing protein [Aphelenchoides avenae]|nr:GRAM domain containing protein [Aphelenchus avenae]